MLNVVHQGMFIMEQVNFFYFFHIQNLPSKGKSPLDFCQVFEKILLPDAVTLPINNNKTAETRSCNNLKFSYCEFL